MFLLLDFLDNVYYVYKHTVTIVMVHFSTVLLMHCIFFTNALNILVVLAQIDDKLVACTQLQVRNQCNHNLNRIFITRQGCGSLIDKNKQ